MIDSVAFWSKVRKSAGCWEWTGWRTSTGYGRVGARLWGDTYAHRIAWRIANAVPIPRRILICHHCDNRICVRPDHLFLGTWKDNAVDMAQKGRAGIGQRSKTHCPKGHQYSGDNLVRRRDGSRRCRLCHANNLRDMRLRRRAA